MMMESGGAPLPRAQSRKKKRPAIVECRSETPVQLMTQWVKDGGGESCLAFWDLGSQISLVTTQYAQERKLVQMGRSSLKLSGLGSGPALRATYRYKVTLARTDGQIVELIAHGLETIASNLDAIDPRVLRYP